MHVSQRYTDTFKELSENYMDTLKRYTKQYIGISPTYKEILKDKGTPISGIQHRNLY